VLPKVTWQPSVDQFHRPQQLAREATVSDDPDQSAVSETVAATVFSLSELWAFSVSDRQVVVRFAGVTIASRATEPSEKVLLGGISTQLAAWRRLCEIPFEISSLYT
jgi:hypothetical protein